MLAPRQYKGNTYRVIFFITIVVLILSIFFSLSRIMIPLGIAYVLSLMLQPLRRSLHSVSLRKKTLSILLALAVGYMFFYPFVKGIKTISEESHRIEYYIPKLEIYLREKYSKAKIEIQTRFNYEITTNPVDKLIEFGQASTKSVFVYLPVILTSLLEWGFIIPLFLFFILKDGRSVRFRFLKIVPNNLVERTYYLFHQFNTKFGDYIFAKFIEAAIVGAIITTGLMILGYPFAFLLGIIAAITNILPYIGPIIGFLPALIIGLVDQNPHTTLGAMVFLYIVANVIDLALVFPILVSKIVNLHPMVVVVSVILGSQFAGVVGMIISIPLAAFIKLLFIELYKEIYSDTNIA
jgi:putative permease